MLIAFATDSTGADLAAAQHAVALASLAGVKLVSLHAGTQDVAVDSVLDVITRWGRPVDHQLHCVDCCDDVSESLVEGLRALRPELIVVGTHARHGMSALLHGSIAEAVIRNMGVPTLVVPNACRPFVAANGSIDIRRIVIPARNDLDARRAAGATRFLLELVGDPTVEITHTEAPLSDVLGSIAHNASLLVMTTHGHDGVSDVLRGSHTEHVIRDATCPVLCVPA